MHIPITLRTCLQQFLTRSTFIVLTTTPRGSTGIAKFMITSVNMLDYKLVKHENSEPAKKNNAINV